MNEVSTSFCIGAFIGFLLLWILVNYTSVPKSVIVKHGCAEYNDISGEFQWRRK